MGQGKVNEALATTAVSEPFESVAFDFLGPFPPDEYSNTYICVAICKFTRVTELEPCRAATAKEAARAALNWVGRYGLMRELQSDRGQHFVGQTVEELLTGLRPMERLREPTPKFCGISKRSSLTAESRTAGV